MSSLKLRKTQKDRLTPRAGPAVALDVGASKIACFIARPELEDDTDLALAGVGHQSSRGFKAGNVTDMDALERSVRIAVEEAERMMGSAIHEVVLGFSGPGLASQVLTGEIALGDHPIDHREVRAVISDALTHLTDTGREPLHAIPLGYSVDGSSGVRDPRGLVGRGLGVKLLVVTAPSSSVRNLVNCVTRAHLAVGGVAASPYASALAVLVEDELDHGALVIDMGASTTSVCAFLNGTLVHLDVLRVGGAHITNDIAKVLGTTMAAAERIKVLHGDVIASIGAERDLVEAPQIGDDGRLQSAQVSRARLVEVIRPRVEETFTLIAERLNAVGLDPAATRRIVLTGGASRIAGVRELVQRVMDRPVRLAKSMKVAGLTEACEGPAFSAAAGLLRWRLGAAPDAMRGRMGTSPVPAPKPNTPAVSGSLFSRLFQAIKDGL